MATGREAGFTYIAVLIAVGIIGAGLAAMGPVWHTLVQRDQEKALLFVGQQFRQALNHYYLANQRYPTSLEQLVEDNSTPTTRRYLRRIFFDPLSGRAEWGIVKQPNEQIVGVYSLSETTPLKTTGFRPRDASFKDKTHYSDWLFMADGQTALAIPEAPASVSQVPALPAPSSRFR